MKTKDLFQEVLDDPTIPFAQRWSLIHEIDRTNKLYGIYKKFKVELQKLIMFDAINEPISFFEVGSGSGGLSLYIKNWLANKNINCEFNLYDSQLDILKESQKKFVDDRSTKIHLATDRHLELFKNKSFDYCISLHVIHHIQPIEKAAAAIQQMHRISKKGVIIIDLDNRPFLIPVADFINKFFGVSEVLRSDGIKSIYRAHPLKQLMEKVYLGNELKNFEVQVTKDLIMPYWTLNSKSKPNHIK